MAKETERDQREGEGEQLVHTVMRNDGRCCNCIPVSGDYVINIFSAANAKQSRDRRSPPCLECGLPPIMLIAKNA